MMVKIRKIIVAGVAVLTAATLGLAENARGADASSAVNVTRPQKISELAADLGYGADLKHLDAAIPYLARNVAPNDPKWNSTHRRWAAVCALIKPSLHDDAQQAFGETELHIVDSAEHALSDGVVRDDLDFAFAFFRSATGRHFLELQDEFAEMSIGMGLQTSADATGNAVENLDARKRLLELWLPITLIRKIYPAQNAESSIDAAYENFSKLRGRQLDALSQRFAGELPQFEAFISSASYGRIVNAEKSIGQSTPPPNLGAFFSDEARRHASEWHAAYLAP
ncbi:MAG: hypothetical protein ABSH33_08095 [Steroidobacteraceae bacterium]|jgi:hypothetical protein